MGVKRPMRFSEKAIRAMPHKTREHFYRQEKADLFMRMKDMTTEEIQREHKRLADKWRV